MMIALDKLFPLPLHLTPENKTVDNLPFMADHREECQSGGWKVLPRHHVSPARCDDFIDGTR